MSRLSHFFLLAATFALASASLHGDSYSDALKQAGVEPDLAGLKKYLAQFHPTPEQQKQVADLIGKLGHDDFNVRELASAGLKKLPVLPRGALEKAARSDDAEVKWRAEELLKSGDEREQVLLLSAMKVIDRQKHKGLLTDLLPAAGFVAGGEARTAAKRAIAATATKEDAPRLRELLKHEDPMLRGAGAAALGAVLGKDAVGDVKPLLKDRDETVQIAAARALADVGDRACLETYVRLLESQQFPIRWEAEASLRSLSGKTIKVEGKDEAEQHARLVQAWRAWVGKEGATAELKFPVQLASRIDLFNGVDLSGWQAVHGGQRVAGKDVWSVKDGVIHCNGKSYGYLRTTRSFLNYELSVEWRWPGGAGVNAFPDSGVWLMLSGNDALQPKGVEAQLGAGSAGDFWLLGGLTCKVKGQQVTGHSKKFADSSEKESGKWNTMDIRVHQGTLTVKVNGVEQNVATDCPKEPGCIALQVEGHPIEFRNISLLPLED